MNSLERMHAFRVAKKQRRLRTAEALCREGLKADRERSAWWNFELGCLYQTKAGNGQKARPCYERVWAEYSQAVPKGWESNRDEPVAPACENLMLISRSYEEYECWASRLQALQPEAAILKWQRPAIKQTEDRDHPWKEALVGIAQTFYEKGSRPGSGASLGDGFGASVWQTLLLHRKEWRLDHIQWRVSLFGYVGHILLLSRDHARAADTTSASGECAFVPENALPLVEEYVRANPNDTEAQGHLEGLRSAAAELRALRWSSNLALARAIASVGLDGLEFRLAESGLTPRTEEEPGGAIGLEFRPVRDAPPGKEYEIGLGLRCVVGLTFPTVVLAADCRLDLGEPAYTVLLGPGVPMPAYYVTYNSDLVGPLQVTSSVGANRWYVFVILMSGTEEDFARQGRVLLQVGPTFDLLRHQSIVLRS